MRRFCELSRASDEEKKITRCYKEHGSKEEEEACIGVHMIYDAMMDYGYFS